MMHFVTDKLKWSCTGNGSLQLSEWMDESKNSLSCRFWVSPDRWWSKVSSKST